MNAIPCLSWVRRGVTKSHLDRVRLGDDDLAKIMKEGTENVMPDDTGDSDSDSEDDSPSQMDDDPQNSSDGSSEDSSDNGEIKERYNLSSYDNERDESETLNPDNKALSLTGLAFYSSIKDDPYIIKDELNSSDEEAEILATDNILALGKVKEDFFGLEICVYNDETRDMFCHHDSILSAFPLVMEWVGYDPGESKPGNLLAIGNTDPHIELWDLDVMDTLEPAFVLQGAHRKKGKKKMKTSGKGHTDAVLDLSWNALQTNALASASADHTIGLWDLDGGSMVVSIAHNEEKVQAVQWHPFEAQTLLSGSFDKTVKVYDCRTTDCSYKSWLLDGEVERVCWNRHDPFHFIASTDTGHITCIDVRSEEPLFSKKVHDSAVTGLGISCDLAGCLMTCSSDKMVKVWDMRGGQLTLVQTKDYHLGELQCLSMCPDIGSVFALGGTHEVRVNRLDKDIVKRFCEPSANDDKQDSTSEAKTTKSKKKKKQHKKEEVESESEQISGEEDLKEKAPKLKKKKKKIVVLDADMQVVEKKKSKKKKYSSESTADMTENNVKSQLNNKDKKAAHHSLSDSMVTDTQAKSKKKKKKSKEMEKI